MDTALPHRSPDLPTYPRRTGRLLAALAGMLLGLWLTGTPPGALDKVDAIGYAICHRIAERSFHVHDRPQPLCARCTGIYLGVALTTLTLVRRGRLRTGRLPRARILGVLVVLGAFYGFDGLNSYLSLFPGYTPLYPPHNTLRLLTGLSFGITLITLALPFLNDLVWRAPLPAAPITTWRELGLLYASAGIVAGLVLVKVPALLFISGIISAASVVFMFMLVGGVVWIMLSGRENSATAWGDLVLPTLAGFAFAIAVLGSIAAARFAFTGTWAGFSLP